MEEIESIFVIGGQQLYSEAINHPRCAKLIITEINGPIIGNPTAYFPTIPDNYKKEKINEFIDGQYKLTSYLYKYNYNENCYLNSLKFILKNGVQKDDRTGVGTISSFGQTLKFSLENNQFPLLTTKKVFFRGVVKELLFFLNGFVDNDLLKKDNIHIWDGNTTRNFLDNRGLNYMEEGSLGKAYGFQWHFWGAPWRGKSFDYKKQYSSDPKVCDQIKNVLYNLKNNPNSRRIVLNAWNVSDLQEMCLEPCHTMYIFNVQYVKGVPKLYCHLTQRSGDMFLGVPFNIASTALLTLILAKASNLQPGGIMITIVNSHIYKNHIEQCKKQLSRQPYHFPQINIKSEINTIEDIEKLSYDDFELFNYKSHPGIKASMAI
jgi:thymidylate synthase